MSKEIIVGIGGASGVTYGFRLIDYLWNEGWVMNCVITKTAWDIMKQEKVSKSRYHIGSQCIKSYKCDDFFSPLSSSSTNNSSAMVIIPCSMGCVARIANGFSTNLLERAADVMIKEQRKLIIVPREMPFSTIHLENLLKLSKMGVQIVPACPSFYGRQKSFTDLVNSVVIKVCNLLGAETADKEKYKWKI